MIDFTRDFCLPCQVMAPWVDDLRQKHAGVVDVVEINLDRQGTNKYGLFFGIDTVPTRVYVDATGRIVDTQKDVCSREELERTLRRLRWIP